MTQAELITILLSLLGVMFGLFLVMVKVFSTRLLSQLDGVVTSLKDFAAATTEKLNGHSRDIDRLKWQTGDGVEHRHREHRGDDKKE